MRKIAIICVMGFNGWCDVVGGIVCVLVGIFLF
jgi:hypothetical protein